MTSFSFSAVHDSSTANYFRQISGRVYVSWLYMGKYHYPKNSVSVIPVACSSLICIYNDKYNGNVTTKFVYYIQTVYNSWKQWNQLPIP